MPKANADAPVAIDASGLGKIFHIGTRGEARFFRQMLARLGGISATRPLWAVRGIDLRVRRGECVGIIGRNGAGKTTLLQMLAGLLAPTEGSLRTQGRISTFLEIGSGLFSELRVLDNIRLTAALCGMSRATLRRRLEVIVEFGELEEYLYSRLGELSLGFQSRVSFATALHADIDILVTDEVFAVGDAAFSGKCVQRMQQLLGEGKTMVMASHDMDLIRATCSRAICLERGVVAGQGPSDEVVRDYLDRCGAALEKTG
ncbi:MAG: ATP-binding cassette domain-containing protein [Elusimicrobiota bacterium]|jgi:lipopolysaccharide transport system ATP-binding protein